VGAKTAQEMLQKGEIYSAREMYNLKIVDVLAGKGKGYEVVDEYIRKHKRIANGMRAIQKVKQFYDPITYEELMGITRIWVEAALQLSDKDIRVMQRVVKAQNRSISFCDDDKKSHVLRTKQDRRFAKHIVSFPLHDSSDQTIPLDRRKTKRRKSDNWQFADKAQNINDPRSSGYR
jgi:DSF synthase